MARTTTIVARGYGPLTTDYGLRKASQVAEETMNAVDQSSIQTRRQGDKEKRGKRLRLLSPCLFVCVSACLLTAGCESGFGRPQNDPLVGIHAPPASLAAPVAPSSATAQTPAAGQTPPLPASYTAPGSAAVAGGETATPDNPRDLRMAADAAAPANPPSSPAVRGVAPGVQMGHPEPAMNDTTSHLAPVPVANGPLQQLGASTPAFVGTAANIKTFDEAQQFLKQRGVTWQRLDMEDDGQWKFECSLRKSANMNSHYVPTTSFPDPLSAIRAVIDLIEKDRR